MGTCPSENTQAKDQEGFWSSDGVHWDAHRIGWAVSGGCAAITVFITMISVYLHCRNYTCPAQQRQIIRILYMPPVFAVISFFSYRYFRDYTYYELVQVVYEAMTLSAFMLLLIQYLAATSDGSPQKALETKDKRKWPIPFCCWRYRPTKPYFLYTIKWLVMQYVVVRPLVSLVGIICEAYNVLCEQEGLTHLEYAYPYLTIVDCFSISLALYGLIVFYSLTKDELKDQRPLAKFLSIKLIVFFTFYQSFVFEILEGRVIHATAYWTETNIANGLNALCICIEMIFFALAMMWAYPVTPYKKPGKRTRIWRPLLDSINFSDFVVEIWSSLKFYIDYWRGKPGARSSRSKPSFAQAFNMEGTQPFVHKSEQTLASHKVSEDAYASSPSLAVNDSSVSHSANVTKQSTRLGYSPLDYRGMPLESGPSTDNVPLTTLTQRNDAASSQLHEQGFQGGATDWQMPEPQHVPPSDNGWRRY